MKIVILLISTLFFTNFINALGIKNYDDPLGIDTKIFEDGFSSNDEYENTPEFIQEQESLIPLEHINYSKLKKNLRNSRKVLKITDLPGYLDPLENISRSSDNLMRFTESNNKQENDYFNPEAKNSNPNVPGKEMEMIRQEGLSNGIVLSENRRTANIETGEFPEMFRDLTKE